MPVTKKISSGSTAKKSSSKANSKTKSAKSSQGNDAAAKSKSEAVVQNPGQSVMNRKLAAEAEVKRVEEEALSSQRDRWSGKVWPAKLTELKQVIQKAEDEGRTPLLLDHTDAKSVDTFYSYQMAQVVEGKKLVLQGRDPAGLAQVMQDSRTLMLRAMAKGYTLYLRMTNCAADVIESYQDPKTLPIEVWDHTEVRKVLGEDLYDVDNPFQQAVDADACREHDMMENYFRVHEEFRVVICSHFDLDDYEEFLRRALPLEKLQAISITN